MDEVYTDKVNYFAIIKNTCLVDQEGKYVEKPYDFCSPDFEFAARNPQLKNLTYIGYGKIFSVNGIEQDFKNSYHFWSMPIV